jgi:hypothetical protein
MDLVKTIAEKVGQAEEALSKKLGGTWTIDEVAIVGQCRVVNDKGESTTVGLEVGVLKDFKTDNPQLITKIDQNELQKRIKESSKGQTGPSKG